MHKRQISPVILNNCLKSWWNLLLSNSLYLFFRPMPHPSAQRNKFLAPRQNWTPLIIWFFGIDKGGEENTFFEYTFKKFGRLFWSWFLFLSYSFCQSWRFKCKSEVWNTQNITFSVSFEKNTPLFNMSLSLPCLQTHTTFWQKTIYFSNTSILSLPLVRMSIH